MTDAAKLENPIVNEKEQIESLAIHRFCELLNRHEKRAFHVLSLGDAPDGVLLENASGVTLNVEVTMTEDRRGDIAVVLGRSKEFAPRPPKERSRAAAATTLKERIRKKLLKDYGGTSALLVQDTSGVYWDWSGVLDGEGIAADARRAYGGGVFVLSKDRETLTRIA